jgi:predicted ATPase
MKQIRSISIENFRGLSKFKVSNLGRVNLLVGKNNTGKTTVLEALRIACSADPRVRMYDLLTTRHEYDFAIRKDDIALKRRERGDYAESPSLAFESLFYGRPPFKDGQLFKIKTTGETQNLVVEFLWLKQEQTSDDAGIRYVPADPDFDPDVLPGFAIHQNANRILFPFDRFSRIFMRRRMSADHESNVAYLSSSGMQPDEIGRVWDGIALTDDEDDVIEALRVISPNIDKLVMVQSPGARGERMLMAKLRQFRTPMPFKSLGEGVTHLLDIVLSMIKAKNGLVLIDEIENGIHYSVQKDLWDLVFRLSAKMDSQIFCTTHSWDCINGFARAGMSNKKITGKVFRLENKHDHIETVDFSFDDIMVASSSSIELR